MNAILDAHYVRLQNLRGQEIVYSNGTTSKTLVAVRTKPKPTQIDIADGVVLSSKNWEWLINLVELEMTPKIGHTIVSEQVTYKVQPSNPNDLAYRYSDGQKTFARVFTEEQ